MSPSWISVYSRQKGGLLGVDKSGVRGALILGVWMKIRGPRTPQSAIQTGKVCFSLLRVTYVWLSLFTNYILVIFFEEFFINYKGVVNVQAFNLY